MTTTATTRPIATVPNIPINTATIITMLLLLDSAAALLCLATTEDKWEKNLNFVLLFFRKQCSFHLNGSSTKSNVRTKLRNRHKVKQYFPAALFIVLSDKMVP